MRHSFESFLVDKFDNYISYRQELGYTLDHISLCLSYFDRYLKDNKNISWEHFNPSFFLEFRKSLAYLNPRTINMIMTVIRNFFWYLQRTEEYADNPLVTISALKEFRFISYVFSEEELKALVLAVGQGIRKEKKYFMQDLAKYVAISLLVHCGMRISEPTRLLLSNYNPIEASVYIEKTKFKKDRLIPISRVIVSEIENYLSVRRSLLDDDHNPYLLITGKDRPLFRWQLYPVFNRAVKAIGLSQTKDTYGDTTFGKPTPHSLRHSFAINTLKRIREQGRSAQNALPVLAAYMGHVHYRHTAVYLKVIDSPQRLELLNFAKYSKELL
jgi:integrase